MCVLNEKEFLTTHDALKAVTASYERMEKSNKKVEKALKNIYKLMEAVEEALENFTLLLEGRLKRKRRKKQPKHEYIS